MTGCDMAAALPAATADGRTLFGWVGARPAGEGLALYWAPPRDHAPGTTARAQHVAVPQVRRTCGVLGARPAGRWGLLFGVNEHGVAAGVAPTRTKLHGDRPGLTGPDVVRLALERAAGARQAADAAADLIARHGQGAFPGCPADDAHDNAFLLADGREAFVLTACGSHWAEQQVGRAAAVNAVCGVRQDWDRLSRGLSGLAIERGWWPADGSKLDFAAALAAPGPGDAAGRRRRGEAVRRLEQASNDLNTAVFRRLLAGLVEDADAPAAGWVVRTGPAGAGALAWCAFGPAAEAVYFPLAPEAEPPAACCGDDGAAWRRLAGRGPAPAALQARLDEAVDEYAGEAADLRRRGDAEGLRRLAGSFMQHNWERLEEAWEAAGARADAAPAAR
jgi:hypothetical protein